MLLYAMEEFKGIGEKVGSGLPLPISADAVEQTLIEIISKGSAQVCREMGDFIHEDSLNLVKLLNCITKTDATNEVEHNEMTEGFYLTLKSIKNSFEAKKNSFPLVLDKHFDKGVLITINKRTALSLDGCIEEKIEELREIDPIFTKFMLEMSRDKKQEQRNAFIHGATEAYLMVYLAFKEPF
jgi:hypothetical protein